jgi:DNA-binding transcriptional MerR regulator
VRPQQQAIIDALLAATKDNALELAAEFLTLEHLIAAANETNRHLHLNLPLTRNTVQFWVKEGLLPAKADRQTRNRLYSCLDLIRLVVISQLSGHFGLKLKAAAPFADAAVRTFWDEQWFLRFRDAGIPKNFSASDLIWAKGVEDGMDLYEPNADATDQQALLELQNTLHLGCVVVVLNLRMIAAFSMAAFSEAHTRKLSEMEKWLSAKIATKASKGDKK